MIMPVFIILILLVVVIAVYRRLDSTVFFIAIVDIFLRIIAFIATQVPDKEISSILTRYFPASIPELIHSLANGILDTLLMWLYVICFAIFEFYIIKSFFKRAK